MMENVLQGMFKGIEPGCCRLTMNGNLAIKTSNGYKSYNVKTGRLTNCSNFVFDIGSDMFFVIPTNKVVIGDVIISNGKPKCVISVEKNKIEAINYEDSTIETIVPERHVMMGNTYFYGKIVSMFGDNAFLKSKKGNNNIMKFAVMSSMMNGNNNTGYNHNGSDFMTTMMKMRMMESMMDGDGFDMFGFDSDESDDDEAEDEA